MATQEASSEVVSAGSRRFLSEVERARVGLRELVSGLRASIQQRESELSGELDRLEREQREREREYGDRMSSLTAIRAGVEEQFKGGEFEDLKRSFLSETVRKMEALAREFPSLRVEFVREEGIVDRVKGMCKIVVGVEERVEPCGVGESVGEADSDEKVSSEEFNVEVETEELGVECVEKLLPVVGADGGAVDYRMRTKPVTTLGHPQIQCQYPQGIAYYEKENVIYFTGEDSRLYRLLLSTRSVSPFPLHYYTISNQYKQGYYPQMLRLQAYGVAMLGEYICLTGKVLSYTTDSFMDVVSKYSFYYPEVSPRRSCNPNNISISTSRGTISLGKHELREEHNLNGITVDSGLIYVCDCKNNQIKVYTGELYYIRTITDPDLHLPLDVKVHGKRVLVLNSKPPYVLEFDQTGFRRDTFLSQTILPDFLPSFLCVDRDGLLLVSDRRQPCVYVFRRERSMRAALLTRLELEHGEDPLVEPRGLCLDGEGRVLVLCCYKQAMLQIF